MTIEDKINEACKLLNRGHRLPRIAIVRLVGYYISSYNLTKTFEGLRLRRFICESIGRTSSTKRTAYNHFRLIRKLAQPSNKAVLEKFVELGFVNAYRLCSGQKKRVRAFAEIWNSEYHNAEQLAKNYGFTTLDRVKMWYEIEAKLQENINANTGTN